MWGQHVGPKNISFEWPTTETLKRMEPDNITLRSIEFRTTKTHAISSVRVTLSNGEESPVFEKANTEHTYEKTILFPDASLIRAVAAHEGRSKNGIWKVSFLDEAGEELDSCNPSDNKAWKLT